jgi:hypothetical protein
MIEASATNKPTSIKLIVGVMVLVAAVLVVRIAFSLWHLPEVLEIELSRAELAAVGLNLAAKIIVLLFTVLVWIWINQRRQRGRWGAIAVLAFCMVRFGASLTVLPTLATSEQLAFQGGALAGALILWTICLLLAFSITFGKAAKAYFHPAKSV